MFDESTGKRLAFLDRNYIPCEIFHLVEEKNIFLGDKENKKCRFCNKGIGETTFKNIAHAIPEFTGNRKLFTYYECDQCNSKFSRLLESHMAKATRFNCFCKWITISVY